MRSGSARARADAVRMDREAAAGGPIVRGFVGSGFRVDDERVFRALLMTVETASEWTPPPLDRLDTAALQPLIDAAPEFILIEEVILSQGDESDEALGLTLGVSTYYWAGPDTVS